MKKSANALLLTGIVLCLLQVWLPAHYLTGDGPCHLYNAQVLHDLWCGKNVAFYTQFFTPFYQPNPNWLSTLVLALLLFVVKGALAEKIFISIYIILFVSGFYLLLKKIGGNTSSLLLVILLFVFPHTLAKGFYNFSFSIAFFFWMIWTWLRFLEKRTLATGSLFFLFTGLLFFTHLLAFGFAVFTCATLLVSSAIAATEGATQQIFSRFFLKNALWLLIFVAPFLILMRWFTDKEGGMQIQLRHHFYRLVELVEFKYLVNVTHCEDYVALIAGILLLTLFSIALVKRIQLKKIHKYDGFLLGFLFALFVYLFFPESFLGHLILISMRAQLFVFITIVCCIGYLVPEGRVRSIGSYTLFGCFLVVCVFRTVCQLSASEGVTDYLSAGSYIKPNSVVLPFYFDPEGRDATGRKIADRNYLFVHMADYMGVDKPLIMLDNFEAYMGYFPLRWTDNTNPYYHLGRFEGIEGTPPFADIGKYKQLTGVTIDYVLMWCFDSSSLKTEYFKTLYTQIQSGYHITYTSPSRRTVLFERN